MMQDNLDKKRVQYFILSLIAVVCLGCIIIVVVSVSEYVKVKKVNDKINDIAYSEPNVQSSNVIVHNGYVGEVEAIPDVPSISETGNISQTGYVSNIPNVDLPSINFNDLLEINDDLIAWLYIPSIDLSYPIVKSSDNKDYLNINFEGNKSIAGTLFTDCRCSTPFYQKTIIYGHNMKDGSMFRKLYNLEDLIIEEPKVYILLPDGKYIEFMVESTQYTVSTDNNTYDINFVDDTDKLILSTCVKNEKRFIVTCKRSL